MISKNNTNRTANISLLALPRQNYSMHQCISPRIPHSLSIAASYLLRIMLWLNPAIPILRPRPTIKRTLMIRSSPPGHKQTFGFIPSQFQVSQESSTVFVIQPLGLGNGIPKGEATFSQFCSIWGPKTIEVGLWVQSSE